MQNGRAVYEIDNLSFKYSSCRDCECGSVLNDISLAFHPGQSVAVLGANGCGKSTLLLLLAGHLRPSGGSLLFKGRDIAGFSRGELSTAISYAAQSHQASFNFTVFEIISMGRAPHLNYFGAMDPASLGEVYKAAAALELDELLERPFGRLSGGEKKRTMLACALAQNAGVMIFDEPDAHLDIRHQHHFLNMINGAAAAGNKLCIFSAHNHDLALRYSTHSLLLNKARNSYIFGPTQTVITEENLKHVYSMDFETAQTQTGSRRLFTPGTIY